MKINMQSNNLCSAFAYVVYFLVTHTGQYRLLQEKILLPIVLCHPVLSYVYAGSLRASPFCLFCYLLSFSTLKKLESANTIASSFWWVFGFYCVVTGGRSLLQDAPYLYWLAVVFLALDVFFMIFCIGIAFVICLALFCCIPILAIAYTMTIREGASEDEIKLLPKYRLHQSCALRLPASTESSDWHSADKLALQLEDSECCICLTQYVEGAELCSLPCNHYFHFGCISRWLRINATCPLCKFNIKAKGDTLV